MTHTFSLNFFLWVFCIAFAAGVGWHAAARIVMSIGTRRTARQ
jgi:hypothetical protein